MYLSQDSCCIKLEVVYNNWVLSCPTIISFLLFLLSILDQFHSTVIQTIQVCIYIILYYIIYIRIQSRCTKGWKQSSAFEQLLETWFLTIEMCTDFPADVIWMNTMCAVSLANYLRAVANTFCLIRAIKTPRSELHKSEVNLIANILLVVKATYSI